MAAAASLLPGLVLVFLARSLGDEFEDSAGNATDSSSLFGCVSLQNAHYNYMKYPGDSVTLQCPKSCREDGPPLWYHSYVKTPRRNPEPLGWKGASHEAAVTTIPTRWGVGYFCCGCEEDRNPLTDSCCWGVAYHPSVNFTVSPSWEREQTTLAPVSSHLLLRCEVRGFPQVDIEVTVPLGFNGSKKVRCSTDKSWYSTVYSCRFTSAEEDSGEFVCRGSIIVDSQKGEEVKHATIAALDLLVYRQPNITYVYQASELQGPQLDIVCVVDCGRAVTCSVSWLFNDSPLSLSGTSYQHNTNGSVHTLSIQQPGEAEVGRYMCVLSSSGGKVEDRKTIVMELPDGVQPSPLGEMPGPVEPVVLSSVNNGPIIALVVTVCSSLVVLTLAVLFIAVFRKKQSSRRAEHEEQEVAAIPLVEVASRYGEEVESDSGVIRSRRSLRT